MVDGCRVEALWLTEEGRVLGEARGWAGLATIQASALGSTALLRNATQRLNRTREEALLPLQRLRQQER